ncbi:MAG: hypothetical protein K2Y56_18410 [Methylobacterium sp.]|uniref:hypothetical protein n=1 Tax=Methylobacterium sp. TaxID=409 RepID=UPI0025DECEE7|nr:hypothetical protein [Methylobacterium sp.]MBX9933470.1 hypothetical protein [Methylobacterium sp.]
MAMHVPVVMPVAHHVMASVMTASHVVAAMVTVAAHAMVTVPSHLNDLGRALDRADHAGRRRCRGS